jgi:hypothetical protein
MQGSSSSRIAATAAMGTSQPHQIRAQVFLKPHSLACHATCTTCGGSTATDCLSCGSSRMITKSNTCPCKAGYFTSTNSECTGMEPSVTVVCHYSCQTCDAKGATGCLSCPTNSNRVLNKKKSCACKSGTTDKGVAVCTANSKITPKSTVSGGVRWQLH